jgi:hypothetical protein
MQLYLEWLMPEAGNIGDDEQASLSRVNDHLSHRSASLNDPLVRFRACAG